VEGRVGINGPMVPAPSCVRLGQHSGSRGGLPSGDRALEDRGQLTESPSSIVGLQEVHGRPGQRPPGGGSLLTLQQWGGLAWGATAQGAAGEAAGLQGTEPFHFSLWS
jgi:hypothetical protein